VPKHDEKEIFDKSYQKKAHVQNKTNPLIIEDLVDYILRVKPTATTAPIRILDLCCGNGDPTRLLLEQLDSKAILVDVLVGHDISSAQIHVANSVPNDHRLHFEVKDINVLEEVTQFDVIVSLFGLHWIENIHMAADKIQRALKPDGLLMFFVPLEKLQLLELRQQQISSPKWKHHFEDYRLVPFSDSHTEYFHAFYPYFECENKEGILGEQDSTWEPERFKQFLASWMQEVRHLTHDEDKNSLVHDIVESIESSSQDYPDVKKLESSQIQFIERFFWYHGTKKSASVALDDTAEIVPTFNASA
jgi:ubiquinone/menaquinone biosynthesis C-methylase UbiE